jgi:WD40 repeat protein
VLLFDLESSPWRGLLQEGVALAGPVSPDRVLPCGASSVWAVAFHPEGKLLAAGTARGEALLWDHASGTLLTVMEPGVRRIRSLSFSRDGRFLAAGCHTSPSVIWRLDQLEDLLAPFGLDW